MPDRLHISELAGSGMTVQYRALPHPHMGSEPWVLEEGAMALVAAAYEAAAEKAEAMQASVDAANEAYAKNRDPIVCVDYDGDDYAAHIRALTPPDATAALERLLDAARKEGEAKGRADLQAAWQQVEMRNQRIRELEARDGIIIVRGDAT